MGHKQALVKAEFKKTTQGRRKSNTNAAVVPEKVLNNLSDNCEGAGYKSCCVLMSRWLGIPDDWPERQERGPMLGQTDMQRETNRAITR